MPKLPAPEIICTLEESSGNSEGLRLVGGGSPQSNPQCSSGGSGSVGEGSGGDGGSGCGDSESEPLRPKSQRRYSQDDIKCHYRSLDVVLGVPNDSDDAPRRLSQQLEKDALLLDPLSVRRQSVASVQTEEVRMSPRQYDRRRRSRCEYDFVSAENRRRRSREEAAAGRTSRRGSSTNELLLRVDQDRRASRESTSSNGYHRRGSTVPQYLSVRDHRDIEARRVSSTSVMSRVSSRPTIKPMDPAERRRHKVVMVCASVAVGILLIAILLIAVTLKLSPTIDEMVRKENEDIFRDLQAAYDRNNTDSGGATSEDVSEDVLATTSAGPFPSSSSYIHSDNIDNSGVRSDDVENSGTEG